MQKRAKKNPLFPVLALSAFLSASHGPTSFTLSLLKDRERQTDSEGERVRECESEGAIETLLHDVLWLIEATFNLSGSPRLW